MRSYILVSFALAVTSAETSGCAAEPGRLQACNPEVPTADTTSMLQLTAKGMVVTAKSHSTAAGDDLIQEAASCPLLTDAVWAAMDAYAEIAYPLAFAGGADFFSYGEKLKAAMWSLDAYWLSVNKTTPAELAGNPAMYGLMNDTDYDGLWVKDGSCILAFRGSDSQIDVNMLGGMAPEGYQKNTGKPGAPNGVQYSAVDFHGLKVHLGVKVELEALLAKMQSNDGLAKIKETCTSGLTLAGHSLGAGTAQLMATLLNKKGDPLGAGLTVDHIYVFGAMAFAKDKAAVNDKSADGCFAGGVYANAPSKDDAGIPKVDLVWEYMTGAFDGQADLNFKHVKTSHHLLVSPTEEMVTPCGEDPPYPKTGKTTPYYSPGGWSVAHAQSLYVDNIGC